MKKIIIFLLTSLWLCACSPVKIPEINTFNFSPIVTTPINNKQKGILLVSMPMAAPGYKTEKIAYSDRTYQLNYFTHNQWIDPPAQMLLPLMVETLQKSAGFKVVVPEPYSGFADWRLESQLLQLQQQFTNAQHYRSNFVVSIRAQLINLHTNHVIAAQTITVTQPVLGGDIYQAIVAANKAIGSALDQLVAFCVAWNGSSKIL